VCNLKKILWLVFFSRGASVVTVAYGKCNCGLMSIALTTIEMFEEKH
jgi:hypothetical protein